MSCPLCIWNCRSISTFARECNQKLHQNPEHHAGQSAQRPRRHAGRPRAPFGQWRRRVRLVALPDDVPFGAEGALTIRGLHPGCCPSCVVRAALPNACLLERKTGLPARSSIYHQSCQKTNGLRRTIVNNHIPSSSTWRRRGHANRDLATYHSGIRRDPCTDDLNARSHDVDVHKR